MGLLLSHALGITVTLKSLNEVKQTVLLYFELDWLARSDGDLKGTKKDARVHAWQTDKPISMLIRLGAAVGEIAIFVPGSLCAAGALLR